MSALRNINPIGYVKKAYFWIADPKYPLWTGYFHTMKFDVLVSFVEGGGAVYENVESSALEPYPKDAPDEDRYLVTVPPGTRVHVVTIANVVEFVIPWRPYVRRCPGQGTGNRFAPPPPIVGGGGTGGGGGGGGGGGPGGSPGGGAGPGGGTSPGGGTE